MRLAKALEKLLQDAHPTRQKELYEACAKALDALRKEGETTATKKPEGQVTTTTTTEEEEKEEEETSQETVLQPPEPPLSQDANGVTSTVHAEPADNFVYWQPFRVALDRSMPVKTRELALGCLHSLIAYKSFRGAQLLPTTTTGGDVNPNHITDRDDFTQIEDPVMSTTTPTHPTSKPSKAPLYVIDDVIHRVCTCFVLTQTEDSVQLQVIKVLLTAVTTEGIEVHNISLLKVIQTCCNVYLYSRNQANQLTAKASLTQMVNFMLQRMEVKQAELRRSAPHSSTSSSLEENAASGLKEGSESADTPSFVEEKRSLSEGSPDETENLAGDSLVDANTTDNENSSPNAQTDSNVISPNDSLRISIPPLSEDTSAETVVGANISPYNASLDVYASILKKDVLMMVRLFCKLSMKPDKEGMDDPTTPNMRGRILVLELLLSIMTNSGYTFQTDELFLPLVRQLCVSLSRNGVSTNPTLFELCLSLFLMILRHFRARLKAEVEVLLNEIYLHILDMSNSTYKQKSMVLQGLVKICADPHTLVDIYVNYDCDLAMISIFEKMVNALSRVAQSKNAKPSSEKGSGGLLTSTPDLNGIDVAQDRRLKLRGLECFVAVVNSLVEWSRDAYSPSPMASTDKDRQKPPPTSTEKEGISAARPMSSSSSSMEQGESSQPPVVVSKKPLSAITMHGQANGFSTSTVSGYVSPHRADTPPPISTTSNGDANEPAQYEEMLSRKKAFEATATLFNSKPTKGLQSFIDQGFVEDDPTSIARFIHSTNTLSKSSIGELIGEADDRSIKVMYAFIDLMRFESPPTGKESADSGFVKALRIFLQAFRLPGEAQKISRIMEKFADRYCDCNPTVFPNADAAYILAYSVIMLNTDQHSNQVKNRMDKGMFLKNNRGQCNGNDFPDEFLGAIFDEISSNEIIMEEEQISELEKQAIWSANANDKQRRELYRRETAQMQKKSQALFKGHERRKIAAFRSAVHIEHVRPMFAVACWPLMATLSTVFEETPDTSLASLELNKSAHSATLDASEQIGLCLDGFTGAIRISSVFRMETERDAFVTSLAKLTGLSRVQDLRSKNVAAIRVIIGIGSSYGEYLEGSWTTILSVISQMDRLQLIGNTSTQDTLPLSQDGAGKTSSPVRMISFLDRFSGGSVTGGEKQQGTAGNGGLNVDLAALCNRRPSFANLVNDMQSQATLIAVDRIFTGTVSLTGTAVVHFFNSLCQVSLVEVDVNSNPRMYSLARIVEMAYYNMGRIRYEWTQIWKVLQPHFNVVGCHSNVQVATFAVDSLRQLSMKFLDRDELSHFHTQNEFLKPFEHIMRTNNSPVIRDLIIRSFHQMISARARNIKSGWKSILVVLSRAAACGDPPIIESAFSIVQWIFTEYFDHVGTSFVDYVSCLVEFAFASTCEDVVGGSIRLLVACARSLLSHRTEGEVSTTNLNTKKNVPEATRSDSKEIKDSEHGKVEEDIFFLKWFPILSGLSRIIIDSESSAIRTKAVDAMFDLLKVSGHQLQLNLWKSVYRSVLLPIFEDLKDPDLKKREAYSVVWIQALRLMVDLYSCYYEILSGQLEFTQVLLDLMILLVGRKSENLSQTGVLCLHQLISLNGHRFTPEIWECVTQAVEKMFAATTPGELIEYDAPAKKWIAGGDRSSGDGRRSNSMSSNTGPPSLSTGSLTESENPDAAVRTEFPYSLVIVKCAVHLVTIQSLRDIAFNDSTSHFVVMPKEHRDRWLLCLYRSYQFAHTFNENYDLRLFLWKTRRVPQMPNLIKQETLSITTYLQILFHIYRTHGDETASDVLELAVRESQSILHRFVPMLDDPQKYSRDLTSWSNLVIAIYRELLTIPWDVDRGRNVAVTDPVNSDEPTTGSSPVKSPTIPNPTRNRTINLIGIRQHLPEYFKLAIKLVVSEKAEIRSVMQGFMERIANRFLADA